MFSDEGGRRAMPTSGRVFVNQTSVTVYEDANPETTVVTKLEKGAPFDIIDAADFHRIGWLYVRSINGKQGYIKDNAQVLTAAEVHSESDKMRGYVKLGWVKIGTGGVLCILGSAVTIWSFSQKSGPGIIWYGAVLAGLGQMGWGVEQLAFYGRARKQFDSVWKQVIS